MSRQALEMIDGDLHAANVDLKAYTDDFYKSVCGAKLEPVKETIKAMWERGVWVEVTTLLIPGYNDDSAELSALADWLVSVSPEMPWHISAFRPTYHLTDAPSTPVSTIHKACDIGRKAGIRYVYAGNVWGDEGEKTFCHNCGKVVIDRVGFTVRTNRLRDGACPDCGEPASGVWA
jgi:pyruvate formate lyase activating enzyme